MSACERIFGGGESQLAIQTEYKSGSIIIIDVISTIIDFVGDQAHLLTPDYVQ